jgi:hypothetical protein
VIFHTVGELLSTFQINRQLVQSGVLIRESSTVLVFPSKDYFERRFCKASVSLSVGIIGLQNNFDSMNTPLFICPLSEELLSKQYGKASQN